MERKKSVKGIGLCEGLELYRAAMKSLMWFSCGFGKGGGKRIVDKSCAFEKFMISYEDN